MNLFRVRGIQVAVHASFFLLLGYIAWEGEKAAGLPGALWSATAVCAFFACVVLHELGHSFTAMHFGIRVPRILLMPIGGMAQFDRIPREPRQELLITVAGPLVNFALAGLLWLAVSFPAGWMQVEIPRSVGDLGRQLFVANLVMGIFNFLPAFPMDGGRILRALLAFRLPYLRATWWAATAGKVVAGSCIVLVLLWPADAAWEQRGLRAALFLFIFIAGETEYRMLMRHEREEEHWRRTLARLAATRTDPPVLSP
ncbi:site-2 protease family protein [Horticoccus luteus]|uniref:Site-2 protease family protein n=1 Tax=Horticoccus luteus TaxID=2862869 RepID=A0A8F9XHU1_9BACT|nr:site-2 protease family protein [Horticoccus luteus]QYM80617.1 site-2 protease family protein [Horticoccus luteus]